MPSTSSSTLSVSLQARPLVGREPLPAPDGRCRLVPAGHVPVGVPTHEVRHLPRRGAVPRQAVVPGDVAAGDVCVHALDLDLLEHRLERRKVPMDVVERRDPHGPGRYRAASRCDSK